MSFYPGELFNSYLRNGEPKTEPGKSKGLTVILDAHSDIFSTGSVDLDTEGFVGLISTSGSLPQRTMSSFDLKPGHNNQVSVSGIVIKSDEGLIKMPPASRNCYFEWENSFLKIYKTTHKRIAYLSAISFMLKIL